MNLVFYSGSEKSCAKGFSGIESLQGDDWIAEMSTHPSSEIHLYNDHKHIFENYYTNFT